MSESFAKLAKLANLTDFIKANLVNLAGFAKVNLADFIKASLAGFAVNFARANLAINSAANSYANSQQSAKLSQAEFTAKRKFFKQIHAKFTAKTQIFQANLHAKFTAIHEDSSLSLSLSLVEQNA